MNESILLSTLSLALTFTIVGCDVDQVRDGELPNVDVDVSGDPGQLPGYDVEGPDVDVTLPDDDG